MASREILAHGIYCLELKMGRRGKVYSCVVEWILDAGDYELCTIVNDMSIESSFF